MTGTSNKGGESVILSGQVWCFLLRSYISCQVFPHIGTILYITIVSTFMEISALGMAITQFSLVVAVVMMRGVY